MTTPIRFIPAGSDVAVKTANNPAKWYTTAKDVPIESEPETAQCPMRTARTVLKTRYQNVDVFFLPHQMQTRATAQQIEHAQNLRFHLLDYDIPSTLPDVPEADNFVHPSEYLARIAVRSTLSCWIIPEDKIPLTRLNRLTRVGARWRSYRVDQAEAVRLLEEAVAAMQRELDDAATRATESQQRADAQLDAVPADEDPLKAQKRYLYRAKQIQERTKTLTENVLAAADVFGVRNRILNVERARSIVDSVATAMQTRARLWSEAMESLRNSRNAEARAMAQQMDAGTVPVGVAADFIQENAADGETQAAVLRDAFGVNAPAEPAAPADDADTFRLVTDDDHDVAA
jgi:hypothetical protein